MGRGVVNRFFESFSFWQFLRIMRAIAASAARGRIGTHGGARARVMRVF